MPASQPVSGKWSAVEVSGSMICRRRASKVRRVMMQMVTARMVNST